MGLQNVKAFCKDNANTIFTIGGIIFGVGAVIEAVHATSKACKKIEDAEYDKWEELGEPEDQSVDISLTTWETVKLVWPNYIFTTILLAAGVTFDICSLRSSQKKIDGLTSMCLLATQTVVSLRESMHENLPPKDIRRVESGVLHKNIEADRKVDKINKKIEQLQQVGGTTTVFRDGYSPKGAGIYFKHELNTMEACRKAVHLFNKILERCEVATINDWYDCLAKCGINVGHSDLGDVLEFEWHADGPMELYSQADYIDPDMDDNAVICIGLKRLDSTDMALPSTPGRR